MTRLALIRHGHTSWNREGRLQGRTDIPLDDAARADLSALKLPEALQGFRIVSSPLKRAVQTARLIAEDPVTVPDLIEMDWGDWEGQHGKRLKADSGSGYRDIETWGWDYRPPGGESVAEVRARVLPWAQGLSADTMAVCHIGIMRVLLACATGWNFDGPAPFAVKRNRAYVLTIGETVTWDGTIIRLEQR